MNDRTVSPQDINMLFAQRGWTIIAPLTDLDSKYLSEDLAQFQKGGRIVDIGFYGDGTTPQCGEFIVFLIDNEEWEQPIAELKFSSFSQCLFKLEKLATT